MFAFFLLKIIFILNLPSASTPIHRDRTLCWTNLWFIKPQTSLLEQINSTDLRVSLHSIQYLHSCLKYKISRDKQDVMKTSEMAVKLSIWKADKYSLYNFNWVNPNQNQYSSGKSENRKHLYKGMMSWKTRNLERF